MCDVRQECRIYNTKEGTDIHKWHTSTCAVAHMYTTSSLFLAKSSGRRVNLLIVPATAPQERDFAVVFENCMCAKHDVRRDASL